MLINDLEIKNDIPHFICADLLLQLTLPEYNLQRTKYKNFYNSAILLFSSVIQALQALDELNLVNKNYIYQKNHFNFKKILSFRQWNEYATLYLYISCIAKEIKHSKIQTTKDQTGYIDLDNIHLHDPVDYLLEAYGLMNIYIKSMVTQQQYTEMIKVAKEKMYKYAKSKGAIFLNTKDEKVINYEAFKKLLHNFDTNIGKYVLFNFNTIDETELVQHTYASQIWDSLLGTVIQHKLQAA